MNVKSICRPLTPARWPDAAQVFAGCSEGRGCWCAFWRRTRPEFRSGWGAGNRAWFRRLVARGAPTGIIAYRGREPVAWCAVAPRAHLKRLAASRLLAPVDEVPVWSIHCFIVARGHRKSGLMRPLIAGAVELAEKAGAPAVEAYPIDPKREIRSAEIFTGILAPFLDQGFTVVARRAPHRPIVRRPLAG